MSLRSWWRKWRGRCFSPRRGEYRRRRGGGIPGHLPPRERKWEEIQLKPAALARSEALMAEERSPWARAVRILRATSRATWI